jgi:hypothetical protein
MNSINSDNHYVISSLSEMSSFLAELQHNSTGALAEAINAQLGVVNFVQSPTLNLTLFDTLLTGLENAISLAQSDSEVSQIRSQFSLMIQNYVFFLNAKIQYELNQHKEEAYKLFEQAGQLLSESVVEIAKCYALQGGGLLGNALNVTVRNVFSQDKEEKSIIKKMCEWLTMKNRIENKRAIFYNTIDGIYKKLDEYNKLIGPSIAINGLLKNYAEPLCMFKYDNEIKHITNEKAKFKARCLTFGVSIALGAMIIRVIWALIKCIWTDVDFSWFLSYCIWVLIATIAYFIIIQIIIVFIYDFPRLKLKRSKQNYCEKLLEIANKFKC